MLTSALAYFNWGAVSALGSQPYDSFAHITSKAPLDKPKWLGPFATVTGRLAGAFVLLGLGCWGVGVYKLARSFAKFAGA